MRITIRSMRSQNEGSEIALLILVENGAHAEQRALVIKVEQYMELRPTKGEIDEETFDRLEAAALFCSAMRCGEHLLAYGSNSVQMLTRKIARHGFSGELSAKAAAALEAKGLICETSDLGREVERCLRRLWGRQRIRAHLWNRGFSQETMKGLPSLLEEIDFVANCAALLRKHYGGLPSEPEEQRRAAAFLSRNGYSVSEIRAAFGRVRGEDERQDQMLQK